MLISICLFPNKLCSCISLLQKNKMVLKFLIIIFGNYFLCIHYLDFGFRQVQRTEDDVQTASDKVSLANRNREIFSLDFCRFATLQRSWSKPLSKLAFRPRTRRKPSHVRNALKAGLPKEKWKNRCDILKMYLTTKAKYSNQNKRI